MAAFQRHSGLLYPDGRREGVTSEFVEVGRAASSNRPLAETFPLLPAVLLGLRVAVGLPPVLEFRLTRVTTRRLPIPAGPADCGTPSLKSARGTMDQTMIEELEVLLRESLPFVVVRSKSGDSISTAEYRERLHLVRSRYAPEERDLISGFAPQIDDQRLRTALLDFIRTEMMDYLQEDRIRWARPTFRPYDTGGAPIDFVLRNLVRRAIVDGEATSAQAFAECVNASSCSFSEFLALPGLQVGRETELFDGMRLIPLSDAPDQLPAFRPRGDMNSIFVRRPGEIANGLPWVRTLLRVDYDVSPIFLKPPKANSGELAPSAPFDTSMSSADLREVDKPLLFQALSMVCQRPIKPVLRWRTHLDPYEIFDLDALIGPTSVTWKLSYDNQFEAPHLVESHVEELKGLYYGIDQLDSEKRSKLQVPITRWITSIGQRDEVDRMIDVGIALDALFVDDGERRDLTRKFAQRASSYLGKDETERQVLYSYFQEIYNNRSGAVHRGVLRKEGTSEEKGEFIRGAQSLCLRSIKTAIARGIPQNATEWETWASG